MSDGIELNGLVVRAGDTELVRGVSLSVRPGQIVALVGQSGSGKSLTARSLLGMVEIDPGVVQADLRIHRGDTTLTPYAECLGKGSRARSRAFRTVRGSVVGYLAQDARAALDPLFRVAHQVRTAAKLSGSSVDPLPYLKRAGFADPARVARLYPHELSGGMAQRAVIAQALARGSQYLLADEPTTGLDPTVQHAILNELRRLADTGIGVVLITHDLRVLPGLADHVVILHKGRVVERCTTDALQRGELESEAGMRLVRATRRVAGGALG
ncbi:MAG: ABC-type glutathione transport system ATPase component [Kiritimatiellia bacterium]|jgi:ABC-type glutathione transport system ATPase component